MTNQLVENDYFKCSVQKITWKFEFYYSMRQKVWYCKKKN